jgi:hypothetical protein
VLEGFRLYAEHLAKSKAASSSSALQKRSTSAKPAAAAAAKATTAAAKAAAADAASDAKDMFETDDCSTKAASPAQTGKLSVPSRKLCCDVQLSLQDST